MLPLKYEIKILTSHIDKSRQHTSHVFIYLNHQVLRFLEKYKVKRQRTNPQDSLILTSAARSVQYFSDWWHAGLSSRTNS